MRIYILKFGVNERIVKVKSSLQELIQGTPHLKWNTEHLLSLDKTKYNGWLGGSACRNFSIYVYTVGYEDVL